MKIIFNAEQLIGLASKTSARSGIFFCTLSLLREFEKYHQVILYTDYKSWAIIKHCPLSKRYKILEPSFFEKILSYNYYLRNSLDPYRKFLPIQLLCKTLTFFTLYLGKKIQHNSISNKMKGDIIFSTYSCFDEKFTDIPSFTLLHDAIPFINSKSYSNSLFYFFKKEIVNLLTPNNYYFANSQYTKDDFLKLFPNKLDANKIRVTHLGASNQFFYDFNPSKNQTIRKKYNLPQNKKYIFSLCTLEPRKNLLFVAKNFIELIKQEKIDDLIFVLGGGYRDSFISKIQEATGKHQDKIIHIGYVDDEDLSNLFSHSLCSIYLSLYEGFGLPALESMQCGCPIIASNTTSLPEVVGNAGILIDPRDSLALQNAILQIYTNPQFREDLRQKGLQQAKQFSWEKCAKEMLSYMEEILKTQKKDKD